MILLHRNTFIPVLEDRERDMVAGTQRDMPDSTACMTSLLERRVQFIQFDKNVIHLELKRSIAGDMHKEA